MNQEYKDRSHDEIYNDITAEKKKIDAGMFGNGNRDDEDAYQAAMNIINRYLTEDYETFDANNNSKIEDKRYYGNLDNRGGRYEFAFNEYHKLYMQFKQEHNDLEAKGTRHYPWQSESEHINRLASRINEIEYDSLINRRVHDAKYSLIDNNKLITSIPDPTAPGYSFIDTPPQFTEGANGKTVAEIFEMTEEKQDPGTIYKIDFSGCTNPDMQKLSTVYVNSNGKMITKEGGGTILETDAYTTTETDITVREGVTISSSKYLSTLADYKLNLDKSIFDKYKNNTVNAIGEDNYAKLLQSNDIPKDSKYGKCLETLKEKHPKLYNAISELKRNTKETVNGVSYDHNFMYEFLAASETKLEHIIVKNKKTGLRLANKPITTTGKGIVQANIVGANDNNREVFFSKGSRQNIGQTVILSDELYDLLDNYDDELVDYLSERIRTSWEGDKEYANITLHDTKINESEMKTIKNPNNEKEKEKFNAEYQLKLYTLTELSQLCYDFEQRYDDIQPPELINAMTYIENVAYDMRRGFNNGRLPTDKKWGEICQEFQRLWLEFKDHDGNRASMRDPTARTYIHNIFYAKNQDTIDRYIKELGNGMTFLDNTTGQHAVENLTRRAIDNASEASKDEKVIQIEKPKIDEYRQLLIKDFGMKEDEKGNPVPMNKTAMDALINAYNSNRDEKSVFNYLMGLTDDGKKDKNRTQYLPNGTDPDDVEDECKNILAGLKSKKELLESNTWKLTPELMKKKLKDQKEELEKRSHLSDDEISRLNGIEVVMEDPECLQKLINDENEAMEISIRYGDMEELISGTLTPYYIKEGGGIKGFDNAGIINDALGAGGGFLNFSDQGCEKVGPMLNMILQEVAVCAIAAAVGTFTAGMGTAAIMAARGTAFGLKVVKVASNLRRVRCIGSMCKLAGTGAKYLERISFAIKNSPKFQRFARWFRIAPTTTTSAGAGTEASLLGRAALATEEVVTSTRAGRVIRNGTETVLNMARKGNQLKEVSTSMKAVGFLLEGTGFHITSTALHNAINGNNFWQGMNPFGSTEYVDSDGNLKEMSNFRGYTESCAFLGIIKAIGGPIQALSKNGIDKLLGSKAYTYQRLAGFFGSVVSIGGEMASMGITDQAISLTFDQKLKGITVNDLIHTVGMVLGLRLTHYIGGKYDKFVVKEYDKAKGEVFVDAIGKDGKPITIKVSKNGDIVRVSDSNTKKPIEDSELKGKNIYAEKDKPQEESSIDQELFDNYAKAQETNLRERYKRFNGDDLKISPEDLQRIIKQSDTKKIEELIEKIKDESTKKFLEEEFLKPRQDYDALLFKEIMKNIDLGKYPKELAKKLKNYLDQLGSNIYSDMGEANIDLDKIKKDLMDENYEGNNAKDNFEKAKEKQESRENKVKEILKNIENAFKEQAKKEGKNYDETYKKDFENLEKEVLGYYEQKNAEFNEIPKTIDYKLRYNYPQEFGKKALETLNKIRKTKFHENKDKIKEILENNNGSLSEQAQKFKEEFEKFMESFNQEVDNIKKDLKGTKKAFKELAEKNGKEFKNSEYEKDYENLEKQALDILRQKFNEYAKVFKEAMKEFKTKSGESNDNFDLEAFMKEQYLLLLQKGADVLEGLIDFKGEKKYIKGEKGRELYDGLHSILKQYENGDITETQIAELIQDMQNKEGFPKDVAKALGFDEGIARSYENLKEAVTRVDEYLNKAYEIVSEVYDPEIEKIIMEDAIGATAERGYYTKNGKDQEGNDILEYSTESKEHKKARKEKEQKMREEAKKSSPEEISKKLGDYLLKESSNENLNENLKNKIQEVVDWIAQEASVHGFSPTEIHDLCETCMKSLIYQTLESQTRTMGDHGINHIAGNMSRFDEYLTSRIDAGKSLGEGIGKAKGKFMGHIIQIFHDIGYSAVIGKGSGHFPGTDLHPTTSMLFFNENIAPLLKGHFTGAELDLMRRGVGSHDGTYFDWNDPIITFVHMADNMAIGTDKFPLYMTHPLIRQYLPTLVKLSDGGLEAGKAYLINQIRARIKKGKLSEADIKAGKLSEAEAGELISAINEFTSRSFDNLGFFSVEGNNRFIPGEQQTLQYYETQHDGIGGLEYEAKIRGLDYKEIESTISNARNGGEREIQELYEKLKTTRKKWGDQITKPRGDYGKRYNIRINGKIITEGNGKVDTNLVKAYLLAGHTVELVTNSGKVELKIKFEMADKKGKSNYNDVYPISDAAREMAEYNHMLYESQVETLNISAIMRTRNTIEKDFKKRKEGKLEQKELLENIKTNLGTLSNKINLLTGNRHKLNLSTTISKMMEYAEKGNIKEIEEIINGEFVTQLMTYTYEFSPLLETKQNK